jgi:hypothetical protein
VPFDITSELVLVVEGRDDQSLFATLAADAGIPDIQIIDAQGKTNIAQRVKAITNTHGFELVRAFGIVRDADADAAAALASLQTALGNAGLPVPAEELTPATQSGLTTAVLVLPGGGAPGELEDMCIDSLVAHPHWNCVEQYVDCIEHFAGPLPKRSKAHVHAFLASMPEPQRTTGVAIDKGYIPVPHAAFDRAMQLLTLLTA